MDKVRVLRIIEYVGDRESVEEQIAISIHGDKRGIGNCIIRAATIGTYPEILDEDGVGRLPPDDIESI